MKRIILAIAAAATIGTGLGVVEAKAQYYGGDDYDRPRRERRYDEDRYERRRFYDEDRYERRPRRGGSICVTARGSCVTRPAPYNSPCGCEIPGFGWKRGGIGG